MKQSAKTTSKKSAFQRGQIVQVSKRGRVFAASIRRVWTGKVTSYLVSDLADGGCDHFVTEAQMKVCKALATDDSGKQHIVALTHFQANGTDVFCLYRNRQVTLAADRIISLINGFDKAIKIA